MLWLARLRIIGAKLSFCEYIMWLEFLLMWSEFLRINYVVRVFANILCGQSFCEYIMWSVTLTNNSLQWARKPLYLWAPILSTLLPFGSYAIIPNFQNCVIMRSPGETWL